MKQNGEQRIGQEDIIPRYIFKDKRKAKNLVIEVNSTTRKKFLGIKMKLGWNNTVYLHTVHDTHALQVTICSHSTDDALHIFYADTVNQTCNF